MVLQFKRQFRRKIGQILLNGGFVRKNDLDHACEEQQRTKELLGKTLVRMGVLKARNLTLPLLIQEYLSSLDDAVKIAAGERQLLGALLVQSGQITANQLDLAIVEQQRSGDKLGEVLNRLGMLNERQLEALLEFQHNQGKSTAFSPIRIGELLVSTGQISRVQLEDALCKQGTSRKKIGEVLVSEGYLDHHKLKNGFRLQKMLIKSVLAAILSLGLSAPVMATSVSLEWNPLLLPELAGYKVYYSADSDSFVGVTPIDVQNQTVATISGLDPTKTYYFAVTTYNNAGEESSYSDIVNVKELSPPSVAITSPTDAAMVSGTVLISLDVADNIGVTKVEFHVNGVLMATKTTSPYTYSWDTSSIAPGTYTLMAKAYDAAGNVGQSSNSVTVVGTELISPTVTLVSPVNYSTVNGIVSVSADASDNIGVTKVEFYCNGSLIYVSNVSPYSFNWDTSSDVNGSYTLMALAYDNAGNVGQSSAATVTVNNPVPDVAAPTLGSFTLPTTYTSRTVPVTGLTATDNIGVTGYLITESSGPPAADVPGWSSTVPSSFTFSASGNRTAYAWAKDAAGNVSSSRSANVVITLPDSIAPTMVSFKLPWSSKSLTVPVSSLTATDNVGVTGYLITESSTPPLAGDVRWSKTAPTSFTFSSAGLKSAYAWAKDAAGNISASIKANVKITLR